MPKSKKKPKKKRSRQKSRTTIPHAQMVENVVAAVERINCNSEMRVHQNVFLPSLDNADSKRQLDILVSIPAGNRELLIGIEVKDVKRTSTIEDMEQLIMKLMNLPLDRRCIVSISGYSDTAKTKAAKHGIELLTIKELEELNWWKQDSEFIFGINLLCPISVQLIYLSNTIADHELQFINNSIEHAKLITKKGEAILVYELMDYVSRCVHQLPGIKKIPTEETFSIGIELDQEKLNYLCCKEEKYPIPSQLSILYKFHRSMEKRPVKLFERSTGEGVVATEIDVIGNKFQVSVVSKQKEDGSHDLFTLISPAMPEKVDMNDLEKK